MSAGPIWLDQVDCIGNETALDKCMHFEWSESNCNHTEDVNVRCSYGKIQIFIPFERVPLRITPEKAAHLKLQIPFQALVERVADTRSPIKIHYNV